jgi:hypothetical protein
MNSLADRQKMQTAYFEELGREFRPWISPLLIASLTVTILLMIIVGFSKSAWMLLGAGRGFIPEGYYYLWGFVLTLATVFGQAIGWAAGSVIVFYIVTLVGFAATWNTLRLAMGVVYLGLSIVPVYAYHLLYGGGLLGLPRVGLDEWLAANYRDAYWLLIYAHPVVELALLPLAVIFLGILWKYGDRLRRDPTLQYALALSLLATSLAVALSLAIHSILVHVRIG